MSPLPQLLCGQEECIQCLLEQEASVLLGDSRGRTSIHLAAARGHASWLSELLSIACSEPPSLPPLRDHSGYTPLHWACYYGQHHTLHAVTHSQMSSVCTGLSVIILYVEFVLISANIVAK